jgi:adenosylmethionine-8-amino-7-oxononanoate aminotransferase
MTHILHRQIHAELPIAVRGAGLYLYDADGRAYLDASGGAAVSCLGHGHPDVLRAIHEQLDKLAYAHTSFFTTEPAEQLADALIADAPAGLSHVFFVSGGSEAIEAALKMAARTSSPSSPRRWSARPPARFRRQQVTSRGSARSAIITACC